MRRTLVSTLAIAPLLGACAFGPKIPAPDTRLPTAFEAPAGEVPADRRLDRWWLLYQDPQLESLVEEALKRAPDARSAQGRLEEALAVRSSALVAYNPQGSLQASDTLTDTQVLSGGTVTISGGGAPINFSNAGTSTNRVVNFDVSWELDLFGRRRAARHKADADLAAAKFDYAAARTSLAANVADSLFQARGLAIQLDDARETTRLERDLSDVARKKADRGLDSAAAADQAEAQTAIAVAQAADLESQLHAARRTLLVLVGRGVDPLDSLPAAARTDSPPPEPASVPGALLARRPDVREAAAKLRSATGQLALDELALFPKFTLTPGVGLTSATGGFAPATSLAWSVGAGLAIPILDQPRLLAEIRAQGARAKQAVAAYEKAVQTAYGEAENALVGLKSDEARIGLLTTAEVQARKAYDATRKGYRAGVIDLTNTLSAERTWRSARSSLTAAQVQALRRSVQVYKALGGGWTPSPLAVAERSR